MGRPSPYSEEFRADAVRLVVDSTPPRSINEVALELGLNRETLRSWVRRAEKEKTDEKPRAGSRRPSARSSRRFAAG